MERKPFKSKAVSRRRAAYSGPRAARRKRFSRAARVGVVGVGLAIAVLVWAVVARALAPTSNSNRQTFDAVIVLGTPADSDGNPTPELLDRITEGVHEYERGVAPRILLTGGAAHNHFVEAKVMAEVARAQGVPQANILEEPQAQDTMQNACYSARILEGHGWHSAEIVSSASHLPRAAMIFSNLSLKPPGSLQRSGEPLEFRMHAASDNQTPRSYAQASILVEVLKTARYLVWARWAESCSP